MNRSISIMSENLNQYENPTLEDYIAGTKASINSDNLYIIKDMPDENIDGVIFRKFSTYTDAYIFDINQIVYTAIINNYSLCFILTYMDDESLVELNHILATIDF